MKMLLNRRIRNSDENLILISELIGLRTAGPSSTVDEGLTFFLRVYHASFKPLPKLCTVPVTEALDLQRFLCIQFFFPGTYQNILVRLQVFCGFLAVLFLSQGFL